MGLGGPSVPRVAPASSAAFFVARHVRPARGAARSLAGRSAGETVRARRGSRLGFTRGLESDTEPYGMLSFVASHVTKVGGGQPTPSAVQQFLEKVDADPEWYPGKAEPSARGPKSAIAPRSQNVVAQSAMSMKRRGEEPTYPALVAANPVALLNPATGKPVGKKRVYAILRERCYDDPGNPQDAWSHHVRFSKSALTADNMAKRRRWGEQELAAGHREEWYFKNVVWTDICNSILARTEQRQQGSQRLDERGQQGGVEEPAR